MLRQGFHRVDRVLLLGAHADDIEIGCGGTLLRLIDERPDVEIAWIVFSGEGLRRAEAEQSAELFLRHARRPRIEVFDFPDRLFPTVWQEVKERFDGLRAEFAPDLVFTHRRQDAHQDHRVLAELTWCTFRDHLIWEYEIPKYEGDLGSPNVFVPLKQEILRRKIAFLHEAFPTQATKPWFLPETFSGLAHLRGLECRAAENVAEAFHCRKLVF
jgi:LmbE family N-acetylglucosaminyl deacetylase